MKLVASGNSLAAQVLIMSLTAAAAPAAERDACMQWLEGLIPRLAESDRTDVAALLAELRAPLIEQENVDVATFLSEPRAAPSELADDERPIRQVKNSFMRWRMSGDDSNSVTSLIGRLIEEWEEAQHPAPRPLPPIA
ncbi:hypothetical protein ASB57_05780 [Bordetella sp. N]|nr:hypothetical protein ASB57_05780 [Bordetella sp. N]